MHLAPQAVLGCSGDFSIERFVKNIEKKNTRVFFCLGERAEIQKETGVKNAGWKKYWRKVLLKN